MNQENIGKFIKDIRIKNKLTQSEFAEKLGVTYQAVSKWENGKNMPDIQILKNISEMFNVDINDILNGESSKKKHNYLRPIAIIALLLLIIVGILLYLKRDNSFSLRQIKSTCDEFNITGAVAFDRNKSSLYITDIEYCVEDDEIYDSITCTLYEEYNDTTTKIASCNNGKNTTIKDYIKTVSIKVDDYKQVCNEFDDVSMYLEVEASNGSTMNYNHKIPLRISDSCS